MTKKTELVIMFFILFRISPVFCQTDSTTTIDKKIFNTIIKEKAFLNWQDCWNRIWPNFSLYNFKFYKENNIDSLSKKDISIQELQNKHHLYLCFFSPDGLKAIDPFSYYEVMKKGKKFELGSDDFNEIRLYDFSLGKAYSLMGVSMYGPKLNGIAWLSDSLFIIVGTEYREVNEENHDYPVSQNAPLILIFDLKNKQIRSYIGEFFSSQDCVKFEPTNFINESMLIFNFK